jgi:hypothetical protein
LRASETQVPYHHYVPASHLKRWACHKRGDAYAAFNCIPDRRELHVTDVDDMLGKKNLNALRFDGEISDGAERWTADKIDGPMDQLFNDLDRDPNPSTDQKSLLAATYAFCTLRHPDRMAEAAQHIAEGLDAHAAAGGGPIDVSHLADELGKEFVDACGRGGLDVLKANAGVSGLAEFWKSGSQIIRRLEAAKLSIYRCQDPRNSFVTGDDFACRIKFASKRRLDVVPLSWRTCALFVERDDWTHAPNDERAFCRLVNKTLWENKNRRTVFYPDAPYVNELGLTQGVSVSKFFPEGWRPEWKIDLDVPRHDLPDFPPAAPLTIL